MKNKRGLSTVVVTLIIILISLVAVGIVWVVVTNLLKSGTEQVSSGFGQLFISLELQKVQTELNGDLAITVHRNAGAGDLTRINFIVSDGTNTKVIKKDTTLSELDTNTFTITPSELGNNFGFVREVSIAPVVGSSIGKVVDTKSTDYGSCLRILNVGQSKGDGIYTLDPDGFGPESSFQVYCDMTTDSGGWTLVQTTIKGQLADSKWANPFLSQLTYTIGSPSIDQPYRLSMKYWYIIHHTQWTKMALTTAGQKKTFDKSDNFVLTGVDSVTAPTKFTYTGGDSAFVLNGLSYGGYWNTCTNGISYFNTACCSTCILFNDPSYYHSYNQPMMSTITAIDGTSIQKWNGYAPLDRLNIFLR